MLIGVPAKSLELFLDGEWETSWEIFTDPDSYWIDTWYEPGLHQDILEGTSTNAQSRAATARASLTVGNTASEAVTEAQSTFEDAMTAACLASETEIGQQGESGYNLTSDLNHGLREDNAPIATFYDAFGPVESSDAIDYRSCEAVDCLHPCYGEN